MGLSIPLAVAYLQLDYGFRLLQYDAVVIISIGITIDSTVKCDQTYDDGVATASSAAGKSV